MTLPYRPWLVRLAARERLSPSFVRLTLAAPDLAHCAPTLLDQRVKLVVGAGLERLVACEDWWAAWVGGAAEQAVMRTYTLAAVRPERGEVDVDVVVHDDPGSEVGSPSGAGDGSGFGLGPISTWALRAAVGTRCVLVAADVRYPGHDAAGVAWRPNGARDVLLVGDETALPAIANIAAVLPPAMTGTIVLEVPVAGDVRDLATPAGVNVTWCIRARGESAADAVAFPAATPVDPEEDLLWDEGSGEADGWYGWVAGEAGMVRRLRAMARAAGVSRDRISFMGYWKQGVAQA